VTNANLPSTDDDALADDDTLPPEHPAGSDGPVSAGEALSGEGIGTGAAGSPPSGTSGRESDEVAAAKAPGDDS